MLGVLYSENHRGLELGVLYSENHRGLELGVLYSENHRGLELEVLYSENHRGLELGVLYSENHYTHFLKKLGWDPLGLLYSNFFLNLFTLGIKFLDENDVEFNFRIGCL